MFRKARRWGITIDEFDMDLLSTISDSGLFRKIEKYVCIGCYPGYMRSHHITSGLNQLFTTSHAPKLKNFSIHLYTGVLRITFNHCHIITFIIF